MENPYGRPYILTKISVIWVWQFSTRNLSTHGSCTHERFCGTRHPFISSLRRDTSNSSSSSLEPYYRNTFGQINILIENTDFASVLLLPCFYSASALLSLCFCAAFVRFLPCFCTTSVLLLFCFCICIRSALNQFPTCLCSWPTFILLLPCPDPERIVSRILKYLSAEYWNDSLQNPVRDLKKIF